MARPARRATLSSSTGFSDAYSLDNFGSILYAMTSADGRLLMWDPAVGGAAVVQPEDAGRGPVPLGRCFVVTNERFIQIFGTAQDTARSKAASLAASRGAIRRTPARGITPTS